MSRTNNGWDNCSRIQPIQCGRDCGRCEERHPVAKEVILACGTGSFENLKDNCPGSDHCRKEEIASLEIDTTCLCKHAIKIDFSTNITFKGSDTSCNPRGTGATVIFKLVKCCNGCDRELDKWTYNRFLKVDGTTKICSLALSDTFCFNYCNCCEMCPGCCVYKVIAIVKDCDGVEKLTCDNSYITAIAQEL